jgi:hypothetical protein
MSEKHLTQIWQWMSVACVLFILTSLVSIQGGSDFVGRVFGDKAALPPDNKPAIGYFGAIIGAGLFFVASLTLALHAIRYGRSWHDRIPVVWLEGLDTSAWEGRIFQVIALVLLLALPAVGIALCIAEAEKGDICELDTPHFYRGSETTLLWPPKPIDGGQMRLRREGSGEEPCKTGIQILPWFWTPVLIYGAPVASILAALFALGAIFVPRRSQAEPANMEAIP